MDWRSVAINDLRNYLCKKNGLANVDEQIKELEESFLSPKSAHIGDFSGDGGEKHPDDRMVNNMVKRAKLAASKKDVSSNICAIEKALGELSDEQKKVLWYFYIDRKDHYVELLCGLLNVERATVYRIKEAALTRFTYACYGRVDL